MNRSMIKTQRNQPDFIDVLWLMFICLVALIVGNFSFHFGVFPVTESSTLYLWQYFSFSVQNIHSLTDFLWAVILASRSDLICLLLIAVSPLVKIQKSFVFCVLGYRSFLFGFCGAYMISSIGSNVSFARGCVFWLIFFLYHVALFAVLICFASATFSWWQRKRSIDIIACFFTVCGELALLILLNAVYYFLISKI